MASKERPTKVNTGWYVPWQIPKHSMRDPTDSRELSFCYLLENKFPVMTEKKVLKKKSFRNLLLTEGIGVVKLPGLKNPPPEESLIPLKHTPQASSAPISLREELVHIQESRGSWMEKSEHFLGPSEWHREPEMSWAMETTHRKPFTAWQAQSWGQCARGEGNITAKNSARAKKVKIPPYSSYEIVKNSF